MTAIAKYEPTAADTSICECGWDIIRYPGRAWFHMRSGRIECCPVEIDELRDPLKAP